MVIEQFAKRPDREVGREEAGFVSVDRNMKMSKSMQEESSKRSLKITNRDIENSSEFRADF